MVADSMIRRKQMAKPYSKLRAGMKPSARRRSAWKAKNTLQRIALAELQQRHRI